MWGLDKIEKRFLVTDSTRQFTIWYAVALENPTGHINAQPFFTMECDLNPENNLCFEADILMCERNEPGSCSFDSIDVLTWTCHRFNIPEEEIGNIVTLEIVMADCGAGAHFGYAYIDGFCEECTGSTLGSSTLYDQPFDGEVGFRSCAADVLTICGRYSLLMFVDISECRCS
ncbi:MAG: hypothetical protein ACJATI_005247 [Halioglobus sp.]|jgi:hypothetical protein